MESMTIFQAIVLGTVQGITEFLPISSDGHLVLVQKLFGLNGSMLAFDVMIHIGTLIAILIFFRPILSSTVKETLSGLKAWKRSRDFKAAVTAYPLLAAARSISVAFVVTCGTVVLIKHFFPGLFDNLTCVAWAWAFTGIALIGAEKIQDGKWELHQITWQTAVLIGLAQAMAALPGVSRSASTILVAIFLGVRRKPALEFSFLMAIPVIFAAVVFELFDHPQFTSADMPVLFAGTLTSLIVGYVVVRAMPSLLEKGWFFKLGWYLLPMSVLAFWLTSPHLGIRS